MLDLDNVLNVPQAEAVRHTAGPLLVLAGAGSGKTRVITYRIAHLVLDKGCPPWAILAVTFTNKAAVEMRRRAEKLLGAEVADVWLGTFHSIGLRVLRRHADLVDRTRNFVIYDEDDRERLLKRVMKDMNISKDVLAVRKVRYYIDDQKHLLRGPNHPQLPTTQYIDSLCANIYQGYEKAKQRSDAFDFSDLIFKVVELLENHPPVLSEWRYRWRYIMVDEFQDTDHAQYKLLKMLAGDKANLCVVGDDDQSIYRWRGADVKNILGFPQDFEDHEVKSVRLEQNYRSTGYILEAASALIRNNAVRHDKTLWTDKESGHRLLCYEAQSESGEARWVVQKALRAHRDGTPLSQVAVFYRTHSQSRNFEDALRMNSIPYKVVGGLKFYERREVKDILAYLRVVQNPRDEIALLRVINTPTRGIGAKTIEAAQKVAREEDVSLFDAFLKMGGSSKGGRARRKLREFGELVMTLRTVAANENDVFRTAEAVLDRTGYLKRMQDEGTLESETRAENVQELLVSIEEWRNRKTDRSLSAFLDHVSLMTSLDESEKNPEALTLMTVHAAKGLEFEMVFVTGLEEDVFPHFNSMDPASIEEERRLAYVAITRGKNRVFLTWARSRRRFGRVDMNPPSRFLMEIPESVRSFESEAGRRAPTLISPMGRRSTGGGWTRSSLEASAWDPGDQTGGWARQSEDQSLDYSDSQVPPSEYGSGAMIGRRVRHPRFGEGRVARIEGQGPDAKVHVQFPRHGSKRIVARFLQPVD